MENLILFISACVGLTFIINLSYVFKPIRERALKANKHFGKLFKCSMCMGFWIGLGIRCLFMWHNGELVDLQWSDLYNVVYGFSGSFFSYSAYLLLKYFMEKYD